MCDDFVDVFMWGLIGFLVLCLIAALVANDQNYKEFMGACKQDHKEYECNAMWRAGEDHTTIMPIVIPK